MVCSLGKNKTQIPDLKQISISKQQKAIEKQGREYFVAL
jgi:hypothetical protein